MNTSLPARTTRFFNISTSRDNELLFPYIRPGTPYPLQFVRFRSDELAQPPHVPLTPASILSQPQPASPPTLRAGTINPSQLHLQPPLTQQQHQRIPIIYHSDAHFATPGRNAPVLPWPDIGHLAKWSVSSYKFGFGPECLKDGDPDTFWHSDGPQPHFITIEFPRKVFIQKLSLYLSFPMDDSYTPNTIAVRAGTGPSDLQDVRVVTLDKPDGWLTFDISSEPNEDGDGFKPIPAYVIQIIVLGNHMNGKDTHVRGVRVLGPMDSDIPSISNFTFTSSPTAGPDFIEDPFPWKDVKFKMYECIR